MQHPDPPTDGQGLDVAKAAGAVRRVVFGPDRPERGNEADEAEWMVWAIAELREVTTDTFVLGHVLGAYLAYRDRSDAYQPAIDLLRAAGADEETAEAKAAWLRQEIAAGRHLH